MSDLARGRRINDNLLKQFYLKVSVVDDFYFYFLSVRYHMHVQCMYIEYISSVCDDNFYGTDSMVRTEASWKMLRTPS